MIVLAQWQLVPDPETGRLMRQGPPTTTSALDLAPLARQTFRLQSDDAGIGLFNVTAAPATPHRVIGATLGSVEQNILETTETDTRAWLRKRFTIDSDPTGATRNKPILPERDGRLRVTFGGFSHDFPADRLDATWSNVRAVIKADILAIDDAELRGKVIATTLRKLLQRANVTRQDAIDWLDIDEAPRRPATAYSDSFTRANEGPPATGWSTQQVGHQVVSNMLDASGTDALSRYSSALSSADHWSQCVKQDNGVGPTCRASSSAVTAYLLQLSGTQYLLIKWVAGSPTTLGTTTETPSNGNTYRLDVSGSNLTGYLGPGTTSKVTATDSAITGNLYAGVFGSASGRTIDDWACDDGVSGGSSIPVFMHHYKQMRCA